MAGATATNASQEPHPWMEGLTNDKFIQLASKIAHYISSNPRPRLVAEEVTIVLDRLASLRGIDATTLANAKVAANSALQTGAAVVTFEPLFIIEMRTLRDVAEQLLGVQKRQRIDTDLGRMVEAGVETASYFTDDEFPDAEKHKAVKNSLTAFFKYAAAAAMLAFTAEEAAILSGQIDHQIELIVPLVKGKDETQQAFAARQVRRNMCVRCLTYVFRIFVCRRAVQ